MGVISAARPYLPGIAFLAVGAILSHLIAGAVDGLQPLVVAVGIGALVGNTAGTPDAAEPGVGVDKLFLETGIVLLGAAVVIEEFLAAGPTVLGLVVVAVGGGLLLAEAIARGLFRLDGTTPSLFTAGASICGVSAVVAIGRVLDARGQRSRSRRRPSSSLTPSRSSRSRSPASGSDSPAASSASGPA